MFGWLFRRHRKAAPAEGEAELVIVKATVDVGPERAFALFVDEIDRWWPRDCTWAREKLARIGIEPRIDGACFEIDKNGTRAVWGTVLTLRRPEHIVFTWQIRADRSAEPNPAAASRVDVRFTAAGDSLTEVIIVHRDFPRHGEDWRDYRRQMAAPAGWPRLISLYAEACQP